MKQTGPESDVESEESEDLHHDHMTSTYGILEQNKRERQLDVGK